MTFVSKGTSSVIKLTVRRVGRSLGVILPSSVTKALKVKDGDTLLLVEEPSGFRITPYDPALERQMKVAETVLKRNQNALRRLSKK